VSGSGHASVLLREAVAALAIKADGRYVDATFGRGGHSREILAQLGEDGRLVALDRDPAAVAAGRQLADPRFRLVHSAFGRLAEVLDELAMGPVDGVLLDLGVSSPQLDTPERGMSFRFDAPRPNGWRGPNNVRSKRYSGTMAKNGLLMRLQRRLLLLGASSVLHAPASLPRSWKRPSARANRASTRRRAAFRLYGFTSIGSLRNCRPSCRNASMP